MSTATATRAPITTTTTSVTNEKQAMAKFARDLSGSSEINGPLAVLDFEVTGGANLIGRMLAERFSADLDDTGWVRVLDQAQVRDILQNETLARTGFPEPVDLQRLAKALGATQVILGTATCAGQRALIHAYAVEPATGAIVDRVLITRPCP